MRVFQTLALASVLSFLSEAVDPLAARQLQDIDDEYLQDAQTREDYNLECAADYDFKFADSNSSEGYVNCFSYPEDTHDVAKFEDMYLIGAIIGFTVTGLAMIFAVTTVVRDEINRHAQFAIDVSEAEQKLMTRY